jgi:hypothetical protein
MNSVDVKELHHSSIINDFASRMLKQSLCRISGARLNGDNLALAPLNISRPR